MHNLLALNQAPIKYDLPLCPANTHRLYTHKTDLHLTARTDKGQAESSQSAPGSVLIKEQVAAPSMHPGFSQERKDGLTDSERRRIRKHLIYYVLTILDYHYVPNTVYYIDV